MAHINQKIIPKGALPLVFAIVAFSLIVVTVAALMPETPGPSPLETAVKSAEFRFADTADGGIVVTTSAGVSVLPPDTNGFVRGAMRAMARERKTRGIGPDDPFVLVLNGRGGIDLVDPAVGTVIDLRAFGSDNARAFAALLPPELTTTTAAFAAPATTSRE